MRLPLLTAAQAAQLYRISASTIRRWAAQGHLPNHNGRYNPADVEPLLTRARPTGRRP